MRSLSLFCLLVALLFMAGCDKGDNTSPTAAKASTATARHFENGTIVSDGAIMVINSANACTTAVPGVIVKLDTGEVSQVLLQNSKPDDLTGYNFVQGERTRVEIMSIEEIQYFWDKWHLVKAPPNM